MAKKKTTDVVGGALAAASQASKEPATASRRRAANRKPYYLQIRFDPAQRKKLDLFCIEVDARRTTVVRALVDLMLEKEDWQEEVLTYVEKHGE